MQNVSELCALWPSDAHLARDLAVPYPTVAAWKQRDSIPAAYWRDLVRAAHRRGRPELTLDVLADLHARRPAGFAEEGTPPYGEPDAPPPVPADHGHFSRWFHLRRPNFASGEDIEAHVRALRDEWDRR
jgi:hypothetical protein